MKKSICTLFSLLAVVLFLTPNLLSAQQNDNIEDDKVIIITKVVDQDGNVTIERKTLSQGTNLEELNFEGLDGKDVELDVFFESHVGKVKSNEDDETVFFFRGAKELNADMKELEEGLNSLRIEMKGDDIVWNQKPGNKISSCSSQKALLGIYPETHPEGVLITGIVKGSGAEAAGLQKGDIITAVSGQEISAENRLSSILAKSKPGETVSVAYLRNGNAGQTNATLTAKKQRSYSYNYNYNYNYSHNNYRHKNRDICKPFIGVYTTKTSKGMKVTSVIDGTAAKRSYIQKGDVIAALDGVQVRSHSELVRERDKHEAGDYFTLTVISGGATIDIEAQFDDCPKEETESVIEEETFTEETPEIQPTLDNTLQLENFNAYPNPTFGAVNIRFEGAAVATKVTIVDITGKVVFKDNLKKFDGVYNRDLNLENATPGTLIVNIQQGQKLFTKPLILLPRA